MSAPGRDPRSALHRLERLEDDAVATRDRWEGLDAAVGALRVAGADGAVEVTVDGRGALVDVRFAERFRTAEAAALSASVLRAVAAAQAALPDAVAEVVGSSGDAARAVIEGYRRRFPPVAPPEPPSSSSSWTWLR